jgi:D-3-phosphoglycerate dehydrogenase
MPKHRVIVCDKVDVDQLALGDSFEVDFLPTISKAELLQRIQDYEVMVVRSRTKVDKEILERAKVLKIIARQGTGLDNIDTEAATRKNILVINSPEALVEAVAEHVVCLMLGLCRKLPEADQTTKLGKWEKDRFVGIELRGKKLGVVGLGRIGRRVAEIVRVFGMSILGYDVIQVPRDVLESLQCRLLELDELFAQADFLTLHVPLTPETKHLADARRLALMKNTSYLINASRGEVVDEEALVSALRKGRLAGAALDVFETEPPRAEMLRAPSLIATPHIGGQTVEGQTESVWTIGSKIREYFSGV